MPGKKRVRSKSGKGTKPTEETLDGVEESFAEEAEEATGPAQKRQRTAANGDAGTTEPERLEDLDDTVDLGGALANSSLRGGIGTRRVPYKNKQRVLVFCSRGVTARYRHLMEDFRALLPHHKKEAKLDSKDELRVVNEIAEMRGCNSTVFFDVRKKRDLFVWFSKTPSGPSVKFHALNVHTMDELRLTGNCLRGSRPLLAFDAAFDSQPHLQVLKEMFTQVFGVPRGHPKSQPFHDHVIGFYLVDGKVWFRHYQIADLATSAKDIKKYVEAGEEPTTLVEIGPRFVLEIVRIFAGSFGGATLYSNPHYVSPNRLRHQANLVRARKYGARLDARADRQSRASQLKLPKDKLADVFSGGGGEES